LGQLDRQPHRKVELSPGQITMRSTSFNFMDNAIRHQREGYPGRTKLRCSDSGAKENDRTRAITLPARPDQTLRLGVCGMQRLSPLPRFRVVCLRRIDQVVRVNAESPQANPAEVDELKI
jgi:hypothetical protein